MAARTLAHAVGNGLTPQGSALQTLLLDRDLPGWREALRAFWTIIREEYPEQDLDTTPTEIEERLQEHRDAPDTTRS